MRSFPIERQPAGNRTIITSYKMWPSLSKLDRNIQTSQKRYGLLKDS